MIQERIEKYDPSEKISKDKLIEKLEQEKLRQIELDARLATHGEWLRLGVTDDRIKFMALNIPFLFSLIIETAQRRKNEIEASRVGVRFFIGGIILLVVVFSLTIGIYLAALFASI